jgi:hypothetical protein
LVAPLKNQDAIDGCSWSAAATSLGDKFIFLAEYDDSEILMNIDGSDVHLKLVQSKGQLKKVGDSLDQVFQADNLIVKAHFTATWVCPKSDEFGGESCENTKLAITFQVSKGSRSEVVRATGDFGC